MLAIADAVIEYRVPTRYSARVAIKGMTAARFRRKFKPLSQTGPRGTVMFLTICTALIFILTYGGIALGRIPGLRLDRAGITLTSAALLMAIGAITPEDAYRAVNLDTLALLLGMMIIVAHLRLSGFLSAGDALGARACAFAADFARHCRGDRQCVLSVPGQ